MQNKPVRFGPTPVTNAVTNWLNPGTLTGGVGMPSGANLFFLLRKIRAVNKTTSDHTFSLFIGATGASAAGTEYGGSTIKVLANSYLDIPCGGQGLRLDVADFLTMVADANTAIVLEAEGEIGVA
jgi:hypothetical protein